MVSKMTSPPWNRHAEGKRTHARIHRYAFKNTHTQTCRASLCTKRRENVQGYICFFMLDRSAVHLWTTAGIVTAEVLICQKTEICGWQMVLASADHFYLKISSSVCIHNLRAEGCAAAEVSNWRQISTESFYVTVMLDNCQRCSQQKVVKWISVCFCGPFSTYSVWCRNRLQSV